MSRAQRLESLLDAATRVLLEGDDALTFESIAGEAGVSATLPYKYFESIDEIAHELYRRAVGQVDDATDALLDDVTLSFEQKVRGSLELWCETIVRDGPLLLRLVDGDAHASLARLIDRRRERAVTTWADVIESEFDIDADAARIVAASLTAGSSAALRRWTQDRIARERVIDVFVALARGQVDSLVRR